MLSLLSRLVGTSVDLQRQIVSILYENPFIESTPSAFAARVWKSEDEVKTALDALGSCGILDLEDGVYRYAPDGLASREIAEFVGSQESDAATVRQQVLELETQGRLKKQLSVTQKEVVAILEMVPAGVILLDAYGNLLKSNSLARDLLGISGEDNAIDICDRLDLTRDEVLESEIVVEVALDRPLSVVSRPFRLKGSDTGTMITLQDITFKKELEASAEREREEFFLMIRHELKKPLLQVEQFLEGLDAEHDDDLARVKTSATHLGAMVDDMLLLARLERDPMAVVPRDRISVNFLLAGGDLSYRAKAQAVGVSLQMIPLEKDIAIQGEERCLNQVIGNLLDNAIRFTPRGGKVWLRGLSYGAEVCVEVEDCGPGIPEDQQGKVLDPFYQIRNDDGRSGGLGLGLAICQKIVEAHSGHLEIGKGDRGGAMVTVSLPIQN
tara:strand:+ start:1544 stop:2863 length:1320 start_codon:yes stop_codon:yes gene_type:complete